MQPSTSGAVSCWSTSGPLASAGNKPCQNLSSWRNLPKGYQTDQNSSKYLLVHPKAATAAHINELFKEFPDTEFCFAILGTSLYKLFIMAYAKELTFLRICICQIQWEKETHLRAHFQPMFWVACIRNLDHITSYQ